MTKKIFLWLISLLPLTKTIAQNNIPESQKQLVNTAKDDTLKFQKLFIASLNNIYSKPDSGLVYAKEALELSQKLNYSFGEAASYFVLGQNLSQLGEYASAISFGLKSLNLFQNLNDQSGVIFATDALGQHYRDQGDYREALKYLFKAKNLTEALPDNANIEIIGFSIPKEPNIAFQNAAIGFSYIESNPDSALIYATKSNRYLGGQFLYTIIVIADAYSKKNQFDSALYYFRSGLPLIPGDGFPNNAADTYIGIANVFREQGLPDSCIFYAKKGLQICEDISYQKGVYNVSGILASVYENIDPVQSIKYYKLNKSSNDSLFNQQKTREAQSFAFNEQLQQQELETQQQQNESTLKMYALLAAVFIFLLIGFFLYRNNRHKQKAFALLQKQKQEIDIQKSKAETTLEELKSTQSQLIQSEKMASLGELTAGIAHEIQNPLNFVNNFSEVNGELISELVDEVDKGNTEEVKAIANDIKDNSEKINHHGKRADAIVKGMLQHSKASTGKKELTDINKLADEYLRLAYHVLRAKDKSFNSEIKTDFDESIDKINIIPQDIGRVLLNLFNNAFYAVSEKQKTADENYKPLVTVATKSPSPLEKGWVEVIVKDNGSGIPQNIVDKIFQPFFTTKPTGQGTGLGLSLAYDIIKAHGGEIKVETKEGEGSEFIIQLPFQRRS